MRNLQALPKPHVHLHLEGCAPGETTAMLAARYGHDVQPDEFDDFASFVDSYLRLFDLVRTPEDLASIIDAVVAQEAAQGVRWLEPTVVPQFFTHLGLSRERVLEHMIDQFQTALRRHRLDGGLVVAVERVTDRDRAADLARLAARYAGQGVVAFGLVGDELEVGVEPFVEACQIARAAGLRVVPHAGEFGPAELVDRTVDLLRPDRIGHGIAAATSPPTMERLADADIVCDVAITSNWRLQIVPEEDHPITTLVHAGVPVSLNTDDQLFFGKSLTDEYEIARGLGLSDADLADIAIAGFRGAAAPEDLRQRLILAVEAWLAAP